RRSPAARVRRGTSPTSSSAMSSTSSRRTSGRGPAAMSKYRIVNSPHSQVDENGLLLARTDGGIVMPTASRTRLGGVKVGDNLTISSGVLSAVDQTYDDTALQEQVDNASADASAALAGLATKQDQLVSGEDIKTVNGTSLLGA